MKNGKKAVLTGYTAFSIATEPYLLVLQTNELPASGWRVRD